MDASGVSALLLKQLWLTGFRSHSHFDMAFAPGVTAIVGPNGSGKTNIVEAISWLATTRSFRGAPTDALIMRGAESAIVRAVLSGENERELLLEAELSRTGRTRIQLNKQRLQRARDLAGTMSVTVFAPVDLDAPGRPDGCAGSCDGDNRLRQRHVPSSSNRCRRLDSRPDRCLGGICGGGIGCVGVLDLRS